MDLLLRKNINVWRPSPDGGDQVPVDDEPTLLLQQLPNYRWMHNPVTQTYRMVHVLCCCHACKTVTVKREDLMRCSNCQTALYCSTECQKKHWKRYHKPCCSDTRI